MNQRRFRLGQLLNVTCALSTVASASVLLALLIVAPDVLAQVKAGMVPMVGPLPIEGRSFEQTREASSDDTPGVLKFGGYGWRDIAVERRDYRALERKFGGADVEIIEHSTAYPYVVKDFFGTFRTAASGDPSKRRKEDTSISTGRVDEGKGEWWFNNWKTGNRGMAGTICVSVSRKGDGVYGGIVGWYTRSGEEITTVMIRFDQLDGIPVKLIDEYLGRHPSSVTEEDFAGETWVADDVRKWAHLLRLQKSDREMFQIAAGRLAEYDRRLFGVDAAQLESEDPAVFNAAIDALNAGLERWLREREAKKRQEKDE